MLSIRPPTSVIFKLDQVFGTTFWLSSTFNYTDLPNRTFYHSERRIYKEVDPNLPRFISHQLQSARLNSLYRDPRPKE